MRTRAAGFAGVGVVVALSPYLMPWLSRDSLWTYGDRWGVLPIIIIVMAVAVIGRRPEENVREKRFWRLLAAGFGCWLVGQGIWSAQPDGGHGLSITADAIFFGIYAFLMPAIEGRPDAAQPGEYDQRMINYTTRSGWLLLACAFAYFYLLPGLLTQEVYDSWQPTTIGVLVCDLYFFVRLLVRTRYAERADWAVRYAWLAVAFAVWIVSDSLQLLAVVRGIEFTTTWPLVQLLAYLPFLPLLLAILHGRSAVGMRDQATNERRLATRLLASGQPILFYALLLPSVHLALYAIGALDETLHQQREILALGALLVLAVVVHRARRAGIAEQLRLNADLRSTSRQLAKTNRDLAGRVRERTQELVQTNRALQQDIERRTAVERKLLQSQSRNEALIAALPDLLYVLGPDCRVLEAYGRPEQSGRSFTSLFSAEDRRPLAQVLESCCRHRRAEQVPATRLEGTELRRYECRFVPLQRDEALVLAQDVTRRRQMDELVQQTQQLESLGTLAGGIAHDFNNLLVGIRGNVQLVRESLPAGHPLQKHLKVAESNSVRAAKLTDNLLAYAGRGDTTLRPLDLRQALIAMEDLLTATLPPGCRLHLHVGQDPLWVLANEPQMTQVMLNLVTNAGEALDEGGGAIWVLLDRQRPVVTADGPAPDRSGSNALQVRLRVRDEGCGMDPETRRRVFDPFFSTKATGRGLGLAAVLGITTQMGCSVAVDSRLGEGTEVTLLLPEETKSRPMPPMDAAGAPRGGRQGKLLVADDEEDVRDLMATALGRMGFEVILAADGREALEAFRREREGLDGVILDYVMPRMNGTEVALRIRREDPRMQVVMMSGYSQREATHSLQDEPNVRFVHKPFDLDEFTFLLPDKKREDSARA